MHHSSIVTVTPGRYIWGAVQDYSGNNIGVLQIALDRSAFVSEMAKIRNYALLMGGITLLIGLGVIFLISRALAKPICHASEIAQNIAYGNYDNDIEIERDDETGKLLKSMLTMQSRLGYDLHEVVEAAAENLRIKIALENVSSSVTVSDNSNTLIYMNKAGHKLFDSLGENIRQAGRSFNTDDLIGTSLAEFSQMISCGICTGSN